MCLFKFTCIQMNLSYQLYFNLDSLHLANKLAFLSSVLKDYRHLPKGDIFALGLTMTMAAGAESLPSNGAEWHHIRKGNLPHIPQKLSEGFYNLLKVIPLMK